jgi:hypothetical protein
VVLLLEEEVLQCMHALICYHWCTGDSLSQWILLKWRKLTPKEASRRAVTLAINSIDQPCCAQRGRLSGAAFWGSTCLN